MSPAGGPAALAAAARRVPAPLCALLVALALAAVGLGGGSLLVVAILAVAPDLEPDVELVKFTPGTDVAMLEAAAGGNEGIVIEGTGLGHVNTAWIDDIEALVDDGTRVVMTSQCLDGRVCDRVYDTGRDLLDAGVIEGEDMLPGTAKVKLMWALANTESVAETMRWPIAGELTERSVPVK